MSLLRGSPGGLCGGLPSRLAFIFHLAALYFLVRGAYTLHNAITTAEMAAMEQSYEREPHGPADDGENAPG